MRCPFCRSDSRVTDTRDIADKGIRRRRKCIGCGNQWTTFETVQKEMERRRIGGGEAFESWLTAISVKLPINLVAKVNLGELRGWYDEGIRLEQAIERIRQIQPIQNSLTPVQQAKFNLIKEKLRVKQQAMTKWPVEARAAE